MNAHVIWSECSNEIIQGIGLQAFNKWIKPLQVEAQKSHAIRLIAPTLYWAIWVKKHYLKSIQAVVTSKRERPIAVEVLDRQPLDRQPLEQEPKRAARIKSEVRLNQRYRFDTFVEGRSNKIAFSAAKGVAKGIRYSDNNPLFIYGNTGLGKTHLMCACGNELNKVRPEYSVRYITAEQFISDMGNAVQLKAMPEFKKFYRSFDVLLIDDIELYPRKPYSQETLFYTFDSLFSSGKQIVITSNRRPQELDNIDSRLRSRFSGGLVVKVELPELETREAILKNKAELRGIELLDEVAFKIAQMVQTNVRELEGALNKVNEYSKITKTPITVELAEQALKDLFSMKPTSVSIDTIQKAVASYYNITVAQMNSLRRFKKLVEARQVGMYLAKELTDTSLVDIGKKFGKKDHTTVIYAHNKIKGASKELKKDIQFLTEKLSKT